MTVNLRIHGEALRRHVENHWTGTDPALTLTEYVGDIAHEAANDARFTFAARGSAVIDWDGDLVIETCSDETGSAVIDRNCQIRLASAIKAAMFTAGPLVVTLDVAAWLGPDAR